MTNIGVAVNLSSLRKTRGKGVGRAKFSKAWGEPEGSSAEDNARLSQQPRGKTADIVPLEKV